jgi:hypothetical protein
MTDEFDLTLAPGFPESSAPTLSVLSQALLSRAGFSSPPIDLSLQNAYVFTEPCMWLFLMIHRRTAIADLIDDDGIDGRLTLSLMSAWRSSFSGIVIPAMLEEKLADVRRDFLRLGRSLIRHPTGLSGLDLGYLRENQQDLVDAEKHAWNLARLGHPGDENHRRILDLAVATRHAPLSYQITTWSLGLLRTRQSAPDTRKTPVPPTPPTVTPAVVIPPKPVPLVQLAPESRQIVVSPEKVAGSPLPRSKVPDANESPTGGSVVASSSRWQRTTRTEVKVPTILPPLPHIPA